MTAPAKRPPLPHGIRIVEAGQALPGETGYRKSDKKHPASALVVERRWFVREHLVALFFCIFWNSLLVPMLWSSKPENDLLFFVFIGAALTYTTLAGLLNKTTLRIANGVLSVRHGPIPWRGNRELPINSIWQPYVRRQRTSKSVTYDVVVEDVRRASTELLSGLRSLEQAKFIRWVIEDHLGIEYDSPAESGDADPE